MIGQPTRLKWNSGRVKQAKSPQTRMEPSGSGQRQTPMKRFEVWLARLDPAEGSETRLFGRKAPRWVGARLAQATRPCHP